MSEIFRGGGGFWGGGFFGERVSVGRVFSWGGGWRDYSYSNGRLERYEVGNGSVTERAGARASSCHAEG